VPRNLGLDDGIPLGYRKIRGLIRGREGRADGTLNCARVEEMDLNGEAAGERFQI